MSDKMSLHSYVRRLSDFLHLSLLWFGEEERNEEDDGRERHRAAVKERGSRAYIKVIHILQIYYLLCYNTFTFHNI
ncbi:hypothetical protein A3J36_02950 [Candidatus Uhrbacteria bacterium RIFCSPLOWO2_02_FULL_54_37]|uniref:Uncharacterized protein n=2 Tax=Candidatus Uhriibacteriota TaxID=1752732 RepID=A0A1F7VG89_9BACT|nr:MAG: hypothetical protein A3B36_02750 [Candidatus Uhrbacteria bacterium RIFCSPLOWO2_01_FULL_55_36]OGL89560.1 MAG: hypothetical protein A3J36_02950 [Candidatus Uhrbacteria bacterium RIFCSPLOWO2_02_FULL_54_37]